MSKTIKVFFFIYLLTFFLSGLIGALHFKQLYNDGAYWALNIVNNSFWHVEGDYFRYITLILQLPAVLSTKIPLALPVTVSLFCLGYFLYPFITLISLSYVHKNETKASYLTLCLLSFILCIVPNWAFGVSIVNESIVVAWILLSYVVIKDNPKVSVIGILSVFLFFSYETAIIFLWLAAYFLYRERKLKIQHISIFLILTLFQFYNVYKNIIPKDAHKHFKTSFPYMFESPLFYLAVGTSILLMVMTILKKKIVDYGVLAIGITLTIFILFHLEKYLPGDYWGFSYFNRVWAIPSSALLLFCGYEFLRRQNFHLRPLHYALMVILTIPGFFFEMNLNRQQSQLHERVQQMIKEKPGCHILSKEEWDKILNGSFVTTWSFAHHSILTNESYKISSILNPIIYDLEGQEIKNHQCSPLNNQIRIKDPYSTYIIPINKRLDFRQVFSKGNH